MSTPTKVAAAAMVAVVAGAFLPWVSVFGVSKLGVEGDGIITLVLAIIGIVLLATRADRRKAGRIAGWACAVLVTLVALYDMNGFAAGGLYVTLFGGFVWIGALVWASMLRGRDRAGTVPPAASSS